MISNVGNLSELHVPFLQSGENKYTFHLQENDTDGIG
jgi:hypothetical protein